MRAARAHNPSSPSLSTDRQYGVNPPLIPINEGCPAGQVGQPRTARVQGIRSKRVARDAKLATRGDA